MKKILIGLGVAIALLMAGMVICMATFHVDRYRPQVVQALQDRLGKPVDLQRLSLGWHGGLAVQADGLAVYDSPEKRGEPLLQMDSASAAVHLLPLLRRQVDVAYVRLLRPRVRVVRAADGRINWVTLLAPTMAPGSSTEGASSVGTTSVAGPATGGTSLPAMTGPPRSAAGTVPPRSPVAFHIGTVRVEDGDVWWIDQVSMPPTNVHVSHVNVVLRNVSLGQPVDFDVRVALWSARLNARIKGRLRAPVEGRAGSLDGVHADLDLSTIDVPALAQSVPSLASVGLRAPLAGKLSVTISHLPLEAAPMGRLAAHVQLSNGTVSLAGLGSPVESIQVDATAEADRVELKTLAAQVAGGGVRVTGEIAHLNIQPRATLKLAADRVSLDRLFPAASPDAPRLRGTLSATFEGAASGPTWGDVSRTLAGVGRVQLSDAKIERLNILREVLDRLSMIPGLVEKLRARLPEASQRQLEARDTVFQPIDVPLTAVDGAMVFRQLQVRSDAFVLSGSGRLGLDGALSSQLMLAVEPGLSGAIVGGVKELQSLTDPDGRFTVPVILQGRLPHITVLPDLEYVASRVLMSKTREWLGGALENLVAPRGEPSPGAPPAQP